MHNYTLNNLFAGMNRTVRSLVIFAALFLAGMKASAQVPPNDNPCGAIDLVAAAACNYQFFTTVDASLTTGVPAPSGTCGSLTDADVWFTVTVPAGATSITIDTKAGPTNGMQDGGMTVYSVTGSCPTLTLTQVACDDDGSTNPGMPKVTVPGTPGQVFYIRMYGFNGEQATFGICVTAAIPPANDNCANATALTVNPDYLCGTVTGGTTLNGTLSPNTPTPTCGTANGWNDDVWYSFVATGLGHRIVLSNIVPAGTSMTMQVYTGTCGALTLVPGGCLNGNTLDLAGLTPGTTYLVRVYTNVTTATTSATFNICVGTAPPPPVNDDCVNATNLTVNPDLNCGVTTAGTTVSANPSTVTTTPATPNCSGTGVNDDVWFKFTATGPTHWVSLSNVSGGTGMTFAVYSGTCAGGLTELPGCNTANGPAVITGLTAGTVYYVRVYTTSATVGTSATFNICVGTPPAPPANDECVNATNLTVNPDLNCGVVTAGTTASATPSAGAPTPTCGTAAGVNDDVWYKFTATGASHWISLTNILPAGTAMTFTVYSGSCGTLTEIGCSTTNLIAFNNLVAGNVYYVRVYTNVATATVFGNYNICVGTPVPPANDECANATALTVNPNYNCGVTTAGTTLGASTSATTPNPTCGTANGWNDDVWYSFVATGAGHRVSLNNVLPAGTSMTMQVYTGTCGALTLVAGGCLNGTSLDLTGLTPGTTYLVRVYTNVTTLTTYATFNICVGTAPPPPTNDECANAISLTVNPDANCGITTPGYTYSATQSATTPLPNCGTANGWNDDVWYTFVATNANQRVSLLNVTGSTTNMTTAVYTGASCSALSLVQCQNGPINNLYGLTVGATYYVRVYTDPTGISNAASYDICVGTIPPPAAGTLCSVSSPFCVTSQPGQTSPTGQPSLGQFGCLFTTPNPTWYVLQVANPGTLVITINQQTAAGVGIDVDYAVWGPFTSVANGCAVIAPTTSTGPPMVSCSYSTAAIETATIPNAQTGEFYILLVTNFNGSAGTITFSPGAGNTGSTNCGIVCNATASNSGPACPGGTFNLSGNSTNSGATYSWTGPGGFTSNVQNPTGVVAPLAPGTYNYTLTVTVNSTTCTATTTVTVTTPPAPTVTSPVTYCQGATASPLTATGSNLLWYTTSTGGVGSSTAPTPSTATIGSTTYYVSQTFPPCEGPRASIVVNVVSPAAPPTVTSPVTYCQGATAVPLTATGTNLLWYTAPTGGTGSSTAPTPSTATAGTTNYYVSQTVGCESPRAQIQVVVNPTPAAPTVTSPVNYCQGATAVPLTATGTNLLWYTVPTGGTGSSTAPTPSTATPGTTTYYVSSTTGSCQGPRAAIVVNVGAPPAAPTVTSPVSYCQNATAVPLTATGTNLLWYTVPTGGTGSATAPTPVTTTPGSTTYYVSQTNGGCEGPRASIVVNVLATPFAPEVITPVTYCQGATAIPLTPSGPGLLWYTTPTGGTGSATAPTPSTATAGTTPYYVSTTVGGCESPRSLVNVVVNPTPAAPTVTSPVNYCQGATAVPLTATGTNLLWYTVPTGGTGSATAPTPSTATPGITAYYVSSTTGSCEGPRAQINVVVTALPAAPAVTSPVNYCLNATAVPLTATGTGLLWYTTPTGGTGTTTAPTPSTAAVGSTTYYVSQSTGTCEGPRAAIVVTVKPLPGAPAATTPVTYCQNTTAAPLSATGTGLLWYTTATGGTGSATAPTPSTASAGTTTYYVSQTTNGCEGPRTAVVVNITPALVANAGPSVTIANGATTQLNGQGTAGANYLWTANGPLALVSPSVATSLNPVVNPQQTTTYTLTVSDPNTPALCPSVSSSMVVTVVSSCINVRNAFTPNGDGINDTWYVYDQSFCLKPNAGVTVNVYNRYGNKVFESQNYTNTWDGTYKGKPVPDGTYYAVVNFVLANGNKQTIRTDVTVLR